MYTVGYILLCIVLRITAIALTWFLLSKDLAREANPIMNWLFSKIGYKKTLIFSTINSFLVIITISLFASLTIQMILLSILAIDAGIDTYTWLKSFEKNKEN